MTESLRLDNFGALVVPEAIRLIACVAQKNPDRQAAAAAVLETLPYPSAEYRERLKSSAFSFFELTRTEFVAEPFLRFVALASEDAAFDAILHRALTKFPSLLAVLEIVHAGDLKTTEVMAQLAPQLRRPESVEHTVNKALATLRAFGLVTRAGGALATLPRTPTLEGLGFILHSQYPARHSLTAPINLILEHPLVRAFGCGDAALLSRLEAGDRQRLWALERTAVFQRVMFTRSLEEYVAQVVEV